MIERGAYMSYLVTCCDPGFQMELQNRLIDIGCTFVKVLCIVHEEFGGCLEYF